MTVRAELIEELKTETEHLIRSAFDKITRKVDRTRAPFARKFDHVLTIKLTFGELSALKQLGASVKSSQD